MKNATFLVLERKSVESIICNLAEVNLQLEYHTIIYCETKIQAIEIDQNLWKKNNSFIPHNLVDQKIPYKYSPIEICWPQQLCINKSKKTLLINLIKNFSIYITFFKEVIDFAPYQNNLKILARNRYREYIKAGFNLQHKKI